MIIILLSQLIIIFAIDFSEYNTTLKLEDFKRNLTFQKQQYFAINIIPNEVENFKQLQPITYQESRTMFYFKEIMNGSFIGLRNKKSTIYALHQNCTLETITQGYPSNSQDFKPNCLQLLIDKDQSHLAIIYPDSIILYNIEFDQVSNLQYNYSDAITDIKLIQKYILISKGIQGVDILNFYGEIIINNFMATENVLQASIQANKLLLLLDGGLLIFNFKSSPRLEKKILVNEAVRFEHNHKLFIIQTKTNIYEYFWKDFIVNQVINSESEITSISLYQEQLQYISNGYLYQKVLGILKNDFNLSQIYVSTYQTNSTHIIGFYGKDQLILQKEQSFEIVFWHIVPSFIIFKTLETGILTCRVDLHQKEFTNESTVSTIQYKIYIEVIYDYFGMLTTIIIYTVPPLLLFILCYLLRRRYLIRKQQQKEQEKSQLNEENSESQRKNDSIVVKTQEEEVDLKEK